MRTLKTNRDLKRLYNDAKAGKLKPAMVIRAFKYVTADGQPPYNKARDTDGRWLTYNVGYTYTEAADTNPRNGCSWGLNVATLEWCKGYRGDGRRLLVVEFTVADIACIPYYDSFSFGLSFQGKFRVTKLDVVQRIAWPAGW